MRQRWVLVEALKAGFPSAKHLAIAGGISVNTAERYRRGETYPDIFTVARLMRHSRVVRDAMLRMAGLDDLSLDQEQAQLVRDLTELQRKRMARHERLAVAYAEIGLAPCAAPEAEAGPGRRETAAAGGQPSPARGAAALLGSRVR